MTPRQWLRGFARAAFCAAWLFPMQIWSGAQGAETKSAGGEDRFLFVVEVSSAMRSAHEATRQTVFDLILSGINQQMRKGDSFGIWTFNEEPHFDYPKQDWNADRAFELASRAAIFLRGQRYEKKAHLDRVLTNLDSVIKSIRDVNVLLITCGEPAMQGTSFDDLVNAEYDRRGDERKKTKKPFVTTIIARDGRIVGASVTLAGEKIAFPARPATAVARSASVAATNTALRKQVERPVQPGLPLATPPSRSSVPTASSEPKLERTSELQTSAAFRQTSTDSIPPHISTSDVPSVITAASSKPAETNIQHDVTPSPDQPPSALGHTNEFPVDTAARSALPKVKTVPSPVALPELKLAAPYVDIVHTDPPVTPAPDPAVGNEAIADTLERPPLPIPGQLTVSARERVAAQPLGPSSPMASPLFTARRLLWIGIGLLAAAVMLLLILIRHSRPSAHGSIISRSLDRQ